MSENDMLRLIVKVVRTCPSGEVTGCEYKTFDIDCPTELRETFMQNRDYQDVSVSGAQFIPRRTHK